jgi:uncharacterized protein (TIGR01777 family)
MNILVTGGTGLIGSHLVKALLDQHHTVVLHCRDFAKGQAMYGHHVHLIQQFQEITTPIDAVINLAGEPIMGKRWTPKWKKELRSSRVGLTRQLVKWMNERTHKPRCLISGSAIGYYGHYPEDQALDEHTSPRQCFPSELCQEWEFEALKAKALGVRVCLLRTGVVLDRHAGALKKMWLPFNLGLGGNVASGKQWFSWVHIDDMVRAILFVLHHPIEGPVNATAPYPVPYTIFTQTLANIMSRPHLVPMPSSVLRLLLGEASQLLIEGQKVVPKVLMDAGFQFTFPEIDSALNHLVKGSVSGK